MSSDEDFPCGLPHINIKIRQLEEQKEEILTELKALYAEKEQLQQCYSLAKLKKNQVSEWTLKDYPWSSSANVYLKEVFKFDTFRPNQLGAINAILSKRDVLVVIPTGGGKSLIYQMAAVITGKLTVVISPLIALIEDQMRSLELFKLYAITLNSSMGREEKNKARQEMMIKASRILFVTPELIANSKSFKNNLTKLYKDSEIALFVIDEVHCCSQWGHDFRTDYQRLSLLKSEYPDVPILGLTATATSNVLLDIQKMLSLSDPVIITAPYNRPNLIYRVVNKPDTTENTNSLVETLIKTKFNNMSGIIYVATQKEAQDLAQYLSSQDISAAAYHASLKPNTKSSVHKKWYENIFSVIVATIAFGMGIDKPDVRFVIHYSVPKSMEALYQETGRAGRDGKTSDCILLYSLSDWLKSFALTQNSREEKNTLHVLDYCLNLTTCRRKLISEYFDDEWRNIDCNEMCDYCRNTDKSIETYDIRPCFASIFSIIEIMESAEVNLTLKKLLDSWFRVATKKLQGSGEIPAFGTEQAEYIIGFLISKHYLGIRRGYTLVTSFAIIYSEKDGIPESPIEMQYNGTLKGLEKINTDSAGTPSSSHRHDHRGSNKKRSRKSSRKEGKGHHHSDSKKPRHID